LQPKVSYDHSPVYHTNDLYNAVVKNCNNGGIYTDKKTIIRTSKKEGYVRSNNILLGTKVALQANNNTIILAPIQTQSANQQQTQLSHTVTGASKNVVIRQSPIITNSQQVQFVQQPFIKKNTVIINPHQLATHSNKIIGNQQQVQQQHSPQQIQQKFQTVIRAPVTSVSVSAQPQTTITQQAIQPIQPAKAIQKPLQKQKVIMSTSSLQQYRHFNQNHHQNQHQHRVPLHLPIPIPTTSVSQTTTQKLPMKTINHVVNHQPRKQLHPQQIIQPQQIQQMIQQTQMIQTPQVLQTQQVLQMQPIQTQVLSQTHQTHQQVLTQTHQTLQTHQTHQQVLQQKPTTILQQQQQQQHVIQPVIQQTQQAQNQSPQQSVIQHQIPNIITHTQQTQMRVAQPQPMDEKPTNASQIPVILSTASTTLTTVPSTTVANIMNINSQGSIMMKRPMIKMEPQQQQQIQQMQQQQQQQQQPGTSNKGRGGRTNNNRPPPGTVNLERSYQICQAVIQNSPNRHQLNCQLKPPPSLLASQSVSFLDESYYE
jgi:hypothetical protein